MIPHDRLPPATGQHQPWCDSPLCGGCMTPAPPSKPKPSEKGTMKVTVLSRSMTGRMKVDDDGRRFYEMRVEQFEEAQGTELCGRCLSTVYEWIPLKQDIRGVLTDLPANWGGWEFKP